jgi:hypothetical protein
LTIESESRKLASLAVFRELYDTNTNIYQLIGDFVKEIVISKNLKSFNVSEMSRYLRESYNFNIPEAVVKSSLGQLDCVVRSQGVYVVSVAPSVVDDAVDSKVRAAEIRQLAILNELFSYVAKKLAKELTPSCKSAIAHAFCSFLLNESNGEEFALLVAAFCFEKGESQDIADIREAVVIYEGLKFNAEPGQRGSWGNDFTIYLDTDVLFHLAGFNGELYKQLFDDLYCLIKEANYKKRYIRLEYFEDTRDEISRFFSAAESIVRGEKIIDPGKEAMASIVNGCGSASDVKIKEINFQNTLVSMGILCVERKSIANKENHQFNILTSELMADVEARGLDKNLAASKCNLLSAVALARSGGDEKYFEKCKAVLITGNGTTLWLSKKVKSSAKHVSLAETLDFLTDRLWFKLNKGFGGTSPHPIAFKAATRARLVLSGKSSNCITNIYLKAQADYKKGQMTDVDLLGIRAACMLDFVGADQIGADHIDQILNLESDPDKYIRDLVIAKEQAKNIEESYKRLKDDSVRDAQNLRREILIRDEILLKDKRSKVIDVLERREREKSRMESKINKFRKIGRAALLVLACGVAYILYSIFNAFPALQGWMKANGILVALGVSICALIYFMFVGKKFEAGEIVKVFDKIADMLFAKIYTLRLDSLSDEIAKFTEDKLAIDMEMENINAKLENPNQSGINA